MHPLLRKLVIAILIFFASIAIIYIARKAPTHAIGSVIGFVLFTVTWSYFFKKFKEEVSIMTILLMPVLSAMLIFVVFLTPSFTLFFILAPLIASLLLGIIAALLFDQLRGKWKYIVPLILFLLPLSLNYKIYDKWDRKVRYGSYKLFSKEKKIANFELLDGNGSIFNNASISEKNTLFFFWSSDSEASFKQFPELQTILDNKQSYGNLDVYAINKPLTDESDSIAIDSIRASGYTFPLLQGNQTILDLFEVHTFPSVLLINKNKIVVYKGEFAKVNSELQKLAAQ